MFRQIIAFALASVILLPSRAAAQSVPEDSLPSLRDSIRLNADAAINSLPLLPDSVQKIVDAIADCDVYEMAPSVDVFGNPSRQYKRLNQLKNLLSTQQLMRLATTHSSAVVKLYAFQLLKGRIPSLPQKLLEQFEADNTIVNTSTSFIRKDQTVRSLAAQKLIWKTLPTLPMVGGCF